MDIEKWRVLVSALDCGSLAAAAACNNYTTSGISRIIASLESEIGFQLLVRSRKGVSPTKECNLLMHEVRALLSAEDAINETVLRVKGFETGSLVIGTSYSSSYGILSTMVAKFVELFPNIKVSILWKSKSELLQSVISRSLDIAVTTNHESGNDKLVWLPFQRTRLVALVPESHQTARQKGFDVEDFIKYPYIDINPGYESEVKEVLREAGIRPNTKYTTSDSLAALALVKAGLGITMIIESQVPASHSGIVVLPIRPKQDIEVGLYFLRKSSLITNRFLSFISQSIKELQNSQTMQKT